MQVRTCGRWKSLRMRVRCWRERGLVQLLRDSSVSPPNLIHFMIRIHLYADTQWKCKGFHKWLMAEMNQPPLCLQTRKGHRSTVQCHRPHVAQNSVSFHVGEVQKLGNVLMGDGLVVRPGPEGGSDFGKGPHVLLLVSRQWLPTCLLCDDSLSPPPGFFGSRVMSQ